MDNGLASHQLAVDSSELRSAPAATTTAVQPHQQQHQPQPIRRGSRAKAIVESKIVKRKRRRDDGYVTDIDDEHCYVVPRQTRARTQALAKGQTQDQVSPPQSTEFVQASVPTLVPSTTTRPARVATLAISSASTLATSSTLAQSSFPMASVTAPITPSSTVSPSTSVTFPTPILTISPALTSNSPSPPVIASIYPAAPTLATVSSSTPVSVSIPSTAPTSATGSSSIFRITPTASATISSSSQVVTLGSTQSSTSTPTIAPVCTAAQASSSGPSVVGPYPPFQHAATWVAQNRQSERQRSFYSQYYAGRTGRPQSQPLSATTIQPVQASATPTVQVTIRTVPVAHIVHTNQQTENASNPSVQNSQPAQTTIQSVPSRIPQNAHSRPTLSTLSDSNTQRASTRSAQSMSSQRNQNQPISIQVRQFTLTPSVVPGQSNQPELSNETRVRLLNALSQTPSSVSDDAAINLIAQAAMSVLSRAPEAPARVHLTIPNQTRPIEIVPSSSSSSASGGSSAGSTQQQQQPQPTAPLAQPSSMDRSVRDYITAMLNVRNNEPIPDNAFIPMPEARILPRQFGEFRQELENIFDMALMCTEGMSKQEINRHTITYEYMPSNAFATTRKRQKTKDGECSSSMATGKSENCSICLDQFVANMQVRRLPCLHIFHNKCIDKWLKRSRKCPICRISINIDYDKLMSSLEAGNSIQQCLEQHENESRRNRFMISENVDNSTPATSNGISLRYDLSMELFRMTLAPSGVYLRDDGGVDSVHDS